MITWRSFTNYN